MAPHVAQPAMAQGAMWPAGTAWPQAMMQTPLLRLCRQWCCLWRAGPTGASAPWDRCSHSTVGRTEPRRRQATADGGSCRVCPLPSRPCPALQPMCAVFERVCINFHCCFALCRPPLLYLTRAPSLNIPAHQLQLILEAVNAARPGLLRAWHVESVPRSFHASFKVRTRRWLSGVDSHQHRYCARFAIAFALTAPARARSITQL